MMVGGFVIGRPRGERESGVLIRTCVSKAQTSSSSSSPPLSPSTPTLSHLTHAFIIFHPSVTLRQVSICQFILFTLYISISVYNLLIILVTLFFLTMEGQKKKKKKITNLADYFSSNIKIFNCYIDNFVILKFFLLIFEIESGIFKNFSKLMS